MKLISLLLLALISGCGLNKHDEDMIDGLSGNSPEQVRSIDNRLLAHVESFESELGRRVNYPIVVGETPTGVTGMCQVWTNGARMIVISSKYIKRAREDQLEQTVYHEMGHCSLGRMHNNATKLVEFMGIKFLLPISLMNAYAFDDAALSEFMFEREAYLNELFGR